MNLVACVQKPFLFCRENFRQIPKILERESIRPFFVARRVVTQDVGIIGRRYKV